MVTLISGRVMAYTRPNTPVLTVQTRAEKEEIYVALCLDAVRIQF
jgi:hypothetical protein